jgi:hypothetical protein
MSDGNIQAPKIRMAAMIGGAIGGAVGTIIVQLICCWLCRGHVPLS